jgi:hypothetical protein
VHLSIVSVGGTWCVINSGDKTRHQDNKTRQDQEIKEMGEEETKSMAVKTRSSSKIVAMTCCRCKYSLKVVQFMNTVCVKTVCLSSTAVTSQVLVLAVRRGHRDEGKGQDPLK